MTRPPSILISVMMKIYRYSQFVNLFIVPGLILLGIASYFVLYFVFHLEFIATAVIAVTIFAGSIDLLRDTFHSIMQKQFVLDYIALVAIATGVISGELVVAAVIVLMLAGGQTLEKYAV